MKLLVDTPTLARALFRVQGVADRKSTMPILAHVLLQTEGNTLLVKATDLDVGLSASYDVEGQTDGSVAVHAKQLYDVIKSLSSEKVTLEKLDNNWVRVSSGTSEFKLVGMAPDEFPSLPENKDIQSFDIPARTLNKLIERTIFCVSSDDNRHSLSGVHFSVNNNKALSMVATDGHRLAMVEEKFSEDLPLQTGVIVPRKGLQELKRLVSDLDDENTNVSLGFSENSTVANLANVQLSTRLVEGQFPDCSQVIPTDPTKSIRLPRTAFVEALKRVSLLSQGRSWGVQLKLTDSNLELVASDPEFGEANENLQIDYKGDGVTVGFNARYLIDVLGLIQDEGVIMELTDELSPTLVKPLEEEGFTAVVMPMRL